MTIHREWQGEKNQLAWGPNIHSDMEEGENPSPARLLELWQWL